MVLWCELNNLVLNVSKTKEIIFDPRSVGDHYPAIISGESVEQVTTHKYLGVMFDSHLKWDKHVKFVCSRVSQRLHFLRRLRVFGIEKDIMITFYRAAIESIIRYGIMLWYGNLSNSKPNCKPSLKGLVK